MPRVIRMTKGSSSINVPVEDVPEYLEQNWETEESLDFLEEIKSDDEDDDDDNED